MKSTILVGAVLASLVAVPAIAQMKPMDNKEAAPAAAQKEPAPAAMQQEKIAPVAEVGQWRASKLIGLNVYNDANEKLGDINEVLLDKSGKVAGIIIGVGGFLGMGESNILVTMEQLKFVDEPVARPSAAAPAPAPTNARAPVGTTTGAAPARAPAATTTTTTTKSSKWYPDHAVLSGVTKDQLKSMPQFKYD